MAQKDQNQLNLTKKMKGEFLFSLGHKDQLAAGRRSDFQSGDLGPRLSETASAVGPPRSCVHDPGGPTAVLH